MWRQTLCILLVLAGARTAAASEPCSASSVMSMLEAGGFARIDRMSAFPPGFLAAFWEAVSPHDGEPRSIADPGSDFQSTDHISTPRLPSRRLIFGGRSSQLAFMYYEKGGRGLARYLFAVCSDGGITRAFSYLSPREARDAEALLRNLTAACLVTPPREHLERSEVDRCL